jgi:hypothetical protein
MLRHVRHILVTVRHSRLKLSVLCPEATPHAARTAFKISTAPSVSTIINVSDSTMDRLFSPGTRLNDLLEENQEEYIEYEYESHDCKGETLKELNLNVSTEEFLSAESAFTYADLYAMLGNQNTFAWLTPHAAVTREGERAFYSWEQLDGSCRFCFNADGKDISAVACSPEHLLEICDIVVRLLAAIVVHSLSLTNRSTPYDASINAPSLAHLMEQCQSLKVLTLNDLEMDENHCRVLGTFSRLDLEIVLVDCAISGAGAITLSEVLGRNQGPTKIDFCCIDNFVLAKGLRGNSSLKILRPRIFSSFETGNRELLAIAGALRENEGLVDLSFSYGFDVKDETWCAIFDSLKAHPTIEVLDFRSKYADATTAPAVLKSRMYALLNMVKMNVSIRTIHLDSRYSQHEIFRESVIPYLETNRFRPRVRAIQKTRPIPYRAKVLGRALFAARNDANSFWMLLSGNAEVAAPDTADSSS